MSKRQASYKASLQPPQRLAKKVNVASKLKKSYPTPTGRLAKVLKPQEGSEQYSSDDGPEFCEDEIYISSAESMGKGQKKKQKMSNSDQDDQNAERRIAILEEKLADLTSRFEQSQKLFAAQIAALQKTHETKDEKVIDRTTICKAIEGLNKDIIEWSMLISDETLSSSYSAYSRERIAQMVADAKRTVMDTWGKAALGYLKLDRESDDYTFLEGMTQHIVAAHLVRVISDDSESESERREKMYSNDEDEILEDLDPLMTVVGWRAGAVPDWIEGELRDIVYKAVEIRDDLIKERADRRTRIDVYLPKNGSRFDPETMEDARDVGGFRTGEDVGSRRRDVVVCGTGLGVKCTVWKYVDGKRVPAEDTVDIALKPAVLLRSSLEVDKDEVSE